MALTPMMQQYLQTKEQCRDAILFYRIGDFYEMFFEDAETASRELELVLTGRDCGLENRAPMCGIPYHAADTYISKLIEKGYKVAICEQIEDPAVAKGLVKRDIIKIVTPGTVLDSSMLNDKTNNYIACSYISKTGFALSICDVSTGEFLATSAEANPTRLIDELSKFMPSEFLYNSTKWDGEEKFKSKLSDKFGFMITDINYDPQESKELVSNKFPLQVASLSDSEVICSGYLYKYIMDTQKTSFSHIVEIKHYDLYDYLVLDTSTRKNLELTETIRSKSKKGSLIWVLDQTETSMGSRQLRKWIEEPLILKDQITDRLASVKEFIDNIYVSSDLRAYLKNVYDIERLISRISCASANARDLISLRQSLKELPTIKQSLSNCTSPLIKSLYSKFDTLDDIYDLINSSIEDNPPTTLKDGGLIKLGYNNDVDKLRSAMTDGKKWIADLEQKEKELTGIKSLKVGYNKVFGYYIEVTRSNLQNVPEDRYIRKQTLSNGERYITQELKECENLILGAEQKIVNIEYELFIKIRNDISDHVKRIQQTAHCIAIIDVLLSFAKVSFENNYCMPNITENGIIDIKNARHPIVEKVISNIFVPNDTYLDTKDDSLSIITGPNMAGKSTYMRQVALISLMAQIGCFVPADEATLSIVDRIFTRIGASDDLSLGQSTFMVEMSEVSYILQNATKNSLIILDEVGRGTSTFDGLSIAWAVVEYITGNIGAKTLFATHYHELTELEGKLHGVKNYSISVKEHGDDIIFLRKIVRGGADQSYGIQVAKLAGLPNIVVECAKTILSKLEEKDINKSIASTEEIAITKLEPKKNDMQISLFDYCDNKILSEIKGLDLNNMTPIEALNTLYSLHEKVNNM